MLKKKPLVVKIDDSDWLAPYADMVTLLMAFFILMLTISSIDQSKVERMQQGLNEALYNNKEVELPFSSLEEKVVDIIKQKQLESQIIVKKDPLGINIQFSSKVLYDSGSARIKAAMFSILKDISKTIIASPYQMYIIEVEGHTDDVPIKTIQFPTNWELSVSRATNVIRYMINQGIPKHKVKASGYGDSKPLLPNKDSVGNPISANRSANRRVIIYIHRDMK
jgi:chemotaxis protein MotB